MPPTERKRLRRVGWAIVVVGLLCLFTLNSSRPGSQTEGCLRECARGLPPSSATLRVMSLNVLHDFPRFHQLSQRLDLVAAEMQRLNVDIVLLQEAPWLLSLGSGAAYLASATGMNHVYVRANGNRWAILFEEGQAILSRYPLRDPSFVELAPPLWSFEHRMALHATAATPLGDIDLFVTHLADSDEDANHLQTVALQTFVAEKASGPALIAGDFNAVETTPQIQSLTRTWQDAYRAIHPTESGATCCVDEIDNGPDEILEQRVDYVFVAPGGGRALRVSDAQRVFDQPFQLADGWLWVSDHTGLLVVVEAVN